MKIFASRRANLAQLQDLDVFNIDSAYAFLFFKSMTPMTLIAELPTQLETEVPSFDSFFTNIFDASHFKNVDDSALPFIVNAMCSQVAYFTRRAPANILFVSKEMHDRWQAACAKIGLAPQLEKICITDHVPKNEIRVALHSVKKPTNPTFSGVGVIDGALQVTSQGVFMNTSGVSKFNSYFMKTIL